MKTILVDAVDCYLIENEEGHFVIDQEMHKLLESYPNLKILLTGADDKQLKQFGLEADKVPYPVFTLEHNPEKTDPEYYRIFLRENNLKSEDCIYFEHNQTAVDSAIIAGIKSYYYDPVLRNLDGLKSFIDSNL